MASKHSIAPSLSSRKRQLIQKTEQKRSLVAKRLSMLQDHPTSPSDPEEVPLTLKKLKSSNADDCQQNNATSTNLAIELDDDSPCDSNEILILSSPSANQTKYRRRRNTIVVSDDESGEDGKVQQLVQVIKNESFSQNGCHGKTKRKRGTSSDSSSQENHKANANLRNPKMESKMVEPPDNTVEGNLSNAMERATKVQASLSAAYPSFVNLMLASHISGGFWLHLPGKFCEVNMPKEDCVVTLVDEGGREHTTKYLSHKKGLSGGWRGFSIHHDLQKGDALVFHLIRPTTFKVYIVREHNLVEVDGALGLLGLDSCAGQLISDTFQKILHTEEIPPLDALSPTNSEIDSDPEVLDGIRFSDSNIKFESIKCFEDFNITVDNLIIDSKFSTTNRKKYYELCHSQSAFLHQQLLKGLNCNLIVGIILETINIVDAIKTCSTSTSIEDLKTWKTTLNGFELLGMKVNFMCAKLNQLLDIRLEVDEAEKCIIQRDGARSRMRGLEVKLEELKGVMEKIDYEIEAEMTASVEKHKAVIKEIAYNTPW